MIKGGLKKHSKIIFALGVFVALQFLIFELWTREVPIFSGCGSQIVDSKLSPNKKYKAVLFTTDCGATTDFITNVSILNSDKELSPQLTNRGNVYMADGYPTHIKMKWNSDKVLVVAGATQSLKPGRDPLNQEHLYKDIKIQYE